MRTHSPVLIYEPLCESHAFELYADYLDERLYSYIPERPPISLDALRHTYATLGLGAPKGSGQTWFNWAIRENAFGNCVGTLQVVQVANGSLWIDYKVVHPAWNRGVGTAAVRWLLCGLHQRFPDQPVLSATDTRNTAAIRVMEKCGLKLIRSQIVELHGSPAHDHVFQSDTAEQRFTHLLS